MERSVKDVIAGLAFIGFGAAFALGALSYDVGTPVRMGPGFFPLVVGVLLGIMGVVIVARSAIEGEPGEITPPPWRALGLIIGALLVFGLTVRGLGLVPTIFLTAILSALASRHTGLLMGLALALGLTVVSVLIFVVALGLRLPLLGPWIPRL
jgi:hypothetical protein